MSAGEAEISAARFNWEEGLRRLGADTSAAGAARNRVADAAMDELRRRLGVTFTIAQLAAAYRDAPAWFTALAHERAPAEPAAWDQATVMDAAFGRYARLAVDAPGRGRR